MSLTARLHIKGHSQEDKGIRILSCDFNFSQDVDNYGKIMSNIRAGIINISISGISDTEIIQWMLSRDARKDCKISFSGVIDTGPHKSIELEDAVLINYHESFTDQSDIIINLSISSRKITISGVTHEMQWDAGEGDE